MACLAKEQSRDRSSIYPTLLHTGPGRSEGGCGDNYPLPTLSNSRTRLCPLDSFRRCGTSLHSPPIDHVSAGARASQQPGHTRSKGVTPWLGWDSPSPAQLWKKVYRRPLEAPKRRLHQVLVDLQSDLSYLDTQHKTDRVLVNSSITTCRLKLPL